MSSALYPASLVPVHFHDPEYIQVVEAGVTPAVIIYTADHLRRIFPVDRDYVPCLYKGDKRFAKYYEESYPGRKVSEMSEAQLEDMYRLDIQAPPLHIFLSDLIYNSKATIGNILGALVLIHRMKNHIKGVISAFTPSSQHRLFLSSLIISYKYLNDTLTNNIAWEEHTNNLFTPRDILYSELETYHGIQGVVDISEIDIDPFVQDIYALMISPQFHYLQDLSWCRQFTPCPPPPPPPLPTTASSDELSFDMSRIHITPQPTLPRPICPPRSKRALVFDEDELVEACIKGLTISETRDADIDIKIEEDQPRLIKNLPKSTTTTIADSSSVKIEACVDITISDAVAEVDTKIFKFEEEDKPREIKKMRDLVKRKFAGSSLKFKFGF